MGFIITMSFVVMLGVVLAFVMFMTYRQQHGKQEGPLRRAERQELKEARITLGSIRDLAVEYRVIDSSDLPYRITDLIDAHNKEHVK